LIVCSGENAIDDNALKAFGKCHELQVVVRFIDWKATFYKKCNELLQRFNRYSTPATHTAETLRWFLRQLPKLREFELSPIPLQVLSNIHTDAPQLKSLKFDSTVTADEQALEAPVRFYLPNVEKLSVESFDLPFLRFDAPKLKRFLKGERESTPLTVLLGPSCKLLQGTEIVDPSSAEDIISALESFPHLQHLVCNVYEHGLTLDQLNKFYSLKYLTELHLLDFQCNLPPTYAKQPCPPFPPPFVFKV